RLELTHRGHRLGALGDHRGLEARLAQRDGQHLRRRWVVLYHEHTSCHTHHRGTVRHGPPVRAAHPPAYPRSSRRARSPSPPVSASITYHGASQPLAASP